MKPPTLDHIETKLRTAINQGDTALINQLRQQMDALQEQQRPHYTLLGAALWYATQGIHVFPLRPGSKIPHGGTNGCKDATADEPTIRAWWTKWPDSNVAIATGHTVDVVDIDGATGQLSRAHHWDIFDSLDVIGVVNTPRPGGMHLYVPVAGKGNKAGLLPGIDYRGQGGYVCAPPSTNPQGTYTWTRPLNISGHEDVI